MSKSKKIKAGNPTKIPGMEKSLHPKSEDLLEVFTEKFRKLQRAQEISESEKSQICSRVLGSESVVEASDLAKEFVNTGPVRRSKLLKAFLAELPTNLRDI